MNQITDQLIPLTMAPHIIQMYVCVLLPSLPHRSYPLGFLMYASSRRPSRACPVSRARILASAHAGPRASSRQPSRMRLPLDTAAQTVRSFRHHVLALLLRARAAAAACLPARVVGPRASRRRPMLAPPPEHERDREKTERHGVLVERAGSVDLRERVHPESYPHIPF